MREDGGPYDESQAYATSPWVFPSRDEEEVERVVVLQLLRAARNHVEEDEEVWVCAAHLQSVPDEVVWCGPAHSRLVREWREWPYDEEFKRSVGGVGWSGGIRNPGACHPEWSRAFRRRELSFNLLLQDVKVDGGSATAVGELHCGRVCGDETRFFLERRPPELDGGREAEWRLTGREVIGEY